MQTKEVSVLLEDGMVYAVNPSGIGKHQGYLESHLKGLIEDGWHITHARPKTESHAGQVNSCIRWVDVTLERSY